MINPTTQVSKGEQARMASFVGALAISDLVKTTLGPKGMDKILQSLGGGTNQVGKVTVTNDGATILRSVSIDNAAAKVLVDISSTQDDVVGDGTTSVVVLAGELLREAEQLIKMHIHPMTIIAGWRKASTIAQARLEKASVDPRNDEEYREHLIEIAQTTLSSKILSGDKVLFSKLAVDAVLRLGGSTNIEQIQIIKKCGGTMKDSFLDEGFILQKSIGVGQPKRVEGAKILIANTPMDTDKIKIYGAKVQVDSMKKVAEIEKAEKEKMKAKVKKICEHGINVFINRQLIYNYPEQLFAESGVMSIEHADFDGIERLAHVTGGEIVSTFDHPETVKLGSAALIEEIIIGEEKMIKFSGVGKGRACSIVLRGASTHLLDEAERSLHDALCVLSQTATDRRVVYGGGCSETMMAHAIDEELKKVGGKEMLAMEAFARALRRLPEIIAENGGYDSAQLVSELRAAHATAKETTPTFGLDMQEGKIGNMKELGILESLKLKKHVVAHAAEAAEMLLRVDDIIKAAPRQRQGMY